MVDTLNVPGLGNFELIETYAYYDEPILFSCKNAAGHLYLVVAADENEQYETWLYAAISIGRLNLIRSGKIDLHDAFADTEVGNVLRVRFPYNDSLPMIDSLQRDQISKDMLPVVGERLDLDTDILNIQTDGGIIAKSRRQEILNLSLNLSDGLKAEAPINLISDILGNFQNVIYTIGMLVDNSDTITEKIRNSMQFSLLEVGTGSFDIRLASKKQTQLELFEDSKCGDAIETFLKLLNAESNKVELKKHLSQLRIAKKYTKFLKSFQGSVVDTKFTWKSPNPNRGGTAYLTNSKIQEVIQILETYHDETPSWHTVTGILIGASLKTNRFEIKTKDKTYTGHLTEEAFDTVENVTLKREYIAEIEEVTERSETTKELTTPKYLLHSLRDNN